MWLEIHKSTGTQVIICFLFFLSNKNNNLTSTKAENWTHTIVKQPDTQGKTL